MADVKSYDSSTQLRSELERNGGDRVPMHLINRLMGKKGAAPAVRAAARPAATPSNLIDIDLILRAQVSTMVKRLMAGLGLDPARFGAHSLRIGGATAALAAGIHPSVIRITGRWASDVWMVYARLTKQAALRVSAVIGSTAFDDTERHTFASEELELTDAELDPLRGVELPVDGEGDDSDDD